MLKRSIIAAGASAGFIALVIHNTPDSKIVCDVDMLARVQAETPDMVQGWSVSADGEYCLSGGLKVPVLKERRNLVDSFGRALAESDIGRFFDRYGPKVRENLAENTVHPQELAIN